MALTRQMLKAMGIEDEKIDQIIESHAESVDGLKKQAEEYREQAAKVPGLEKKIEELSAESTDEGEWQEKFEAEHKAFEEFKAATLAETAKRVKTDLYRGLLRESGVDEKRIESILKVTDLESIEVVEGAITDRDAQAEKIKAEWSDFIVKKRTEGAQVDDPPKEPTNNFENLSLAEKMQYANANPGDPNVKAWLAN